jgi:hypothetical protein
MKGEDADLVEAYKGWKKLPTQKYVELVKSIISSAGNFSLLSYQGLVNPVRRKRSQLLLWRKS